MHQDVRDASDSDRDYMLTHGPHMSILQLLLALLYVTILCDLLYVLSSRYFVPWRPQGTKQGSRYTVHPGGGSKRMPNMTQVTPPVSNKSGKNLTLDCLWRRLKAEARHLQRVNSQHRTITEAMMETRLKARSVERERSLTRSRSRRFTMADQKFDMVRWAARIGSDHDPRTK